MTREEALKILRGTHDKALFSVRNALETLIPELTESEDERIRKRLITLIRVLDSSFFTGNNPSKEQCLAYLEKQKEQKSAEWSEEDEKMLNNLIWAVHMKSISPCDEMDDRNVYEKYEKFLKSLRPSWKPSEEQMAALYTAARESPVIKENGNYLYDLYNDLKKLM